MKFQKNLPKISPEQFAKARDSIRIVEPQGHMKILLYRKNFEYNSGKINHFSKSLK